MATDIEVLRDELRARVGKRSVNVIADARLDFCLKFAIVQLSSPKVHRHTELQSRQLVTTADGSAVGATADQAEGRYPLPAPVWTLYSCRDTTAANIRRLYPLGVQEMDEISKSFGQPLYYSRWGLSASAGQHEVEFDPVPNGIFTIYFRCFLYPTFTYTNLLLSGDSPLHETYDEGILLGAEQRVWGNVLQDPRRAVVLREQLADWMETITSPMEGDLDDQDDILRPDTDGLGR